MREELENRQFQLERLRNEGQPLCEEIEKNNEHLIYSVEDCSEEEIRLLEEALGEEAEKQKPQRIPRRQFLMGCNEILETWHDTIIGAQLNIMGIERTLGAERHNYHTGSKMIYLRNPDGSYTFKASDKAPVGFKPPKEKKLKVTDSKVWAKKLKERQVKQNERNRTAIESD